MKFYIPFGDYSGDGHKQYCNVLVSAPSMEGVAAAQKFYEEKYDEWFWRKYADDYGDPSITPEIEQALLDTNYPIERFSQYQDDISFDDFKTLEELFNSDFWKKEWKHNITLDTCIDTFIWLLNAAGAEIMREPDYPVIGWSCGQFKSVGYGCFYD